MSKIEVNTVDAQCGSTITVGSSGKNVKIEGNDIRSNDYKASDGGNIINQSGTTITLGASGDTVSLASGASQTGFGRTGTVDWQTSSIKTTTFTAANGEGYFADTSSGAFTMNLPAGTAGNIVSVVDYTNTFQTHNLTITPNGSQKIGGVAASSVLSTEGQSVTLVYVDDTEGWKNVQDSTSNVSGNPNLVATGGTVTTVCTNFKVHTFTGPGTFTVSNASTTAANNIVSYLVLAGGGGSAGNGLGAGGAGGYREYKGPADTYTASPLNGNPGGTAVTVTAQAYPITVGGGGTAGTAGSPQKSGGGSPSVFSTVTSTGGGGGASAGSDRASTPVDGGSGGGGSRDNTPGGSGNTPPVNPSQGNGGGTGIFAGPQYGAGGGGGAGGAGSNGTSSAGGSGGAGVTSSINGSPAARAGGGGGGTYSSASGGAGGSGGGGDQQNNGQAETGGGAGGSVGSSVSGFTGGGGVVIIRYKFQ